VALPLIGSSREYGESLELKSFRKKIQNICFSCFPHIVNLACKAALEAITEVQLAEASAPDYEFPPTATLDEKDSIATLRSLIVSVCHSILLLNSLTESLVDSELVSLSTGILDYCAGGVQEGFAAAA
jgi:hypothetical protein